MNFNKENINRITVSKFKYHISIKDHMKIVSRDDYQIFLLTVFKNCQLKFIL